MSLIDQFAKKAGELNEMHDKASGQAKALQDMGNNALGQVDALSGKAKALQDMGKNAVGDLSKNIPTVPPSLSGALGGQGTEALGSLGDNTMPKALGDKLGALNSKVDALNGKANELQALGAAQVDALKNKIPPVPPLPPIPEVPPLPSLLAGSPVAQVVATAQLKCSFGTAPSSLQVMHDKSVKCEGQEAANITDCIPFKNILPFGMCTSPSHPGVIAALGSPVPCTPVPAPWLPGSQTVGLGTLGALTKDSKIPLCVLGQGSIEITDPGQKNTKVT